MKNGLFGLVKMGKGCLFELSGKNYTVKICVTGCDVYNVVIIGENISESYSIMHCYRDVYRVGQLIQSGVKTKLTMEYDAENDEWDMLYPDEGIFKMIIKTIKMIEKLNFVVNKAASDEKHLRW